MSVFDKLLTAKTARCFNCSCIRNSSHMNVFLAWKMNTKSRYTEDGREVRYILAICHTISDK